MFEPEGIAPLSAQEDLLNSSTRNLYVLLSALAIGVVAYFAQWWFQPDHLPITFQGTPGFLANILLFLLVTYVVWHPIVMQLFYWAVAYQIQDAVYIAPPEESPV